MEPTDIEKYLAELKSSWNVVTSPPARGGAGGGGSKISQEFKFKDFKEAIAFVNKIAELAENEGHHPDIHIFYNKVLVEIWTHFIGGLSENDFILASKIELL